MMKNKGFTLLESIMSVAIMVAIVFAATLLAKDVLSTNQSAVQSLSAQSDTRRAIKSWIAELRTATPSATGAYTIESASTSSLVFFADLDSDNRSERIRYFISTSTRSFNRGVVSPTGSPPSYVLSGESVITMVSDMVQGTSTPVFEYFDTNYAGTSSPMTYPLDVSMIRLIRVNISVDKDPNRSPDPLTVSSEVTLRNLKDN